MIDNDAADDASRSDLASCHLCISCVKHLTSCPLDDSGIVMECVEYLAKETTA